MLLPIYRYAQNVRALMFAWIHIAPLFLLQGYTIASEVPSFKSVPTTVKTYEHDTVLLPCYVDNIGANVIKWWKDGTLVFDTSNKSLVVPVNIRMFSNNTLEVSDVGILDTGEYICQVVRPQPWGPLNQIHAIEVQFAPTVTAIPSSRDLEIALNEEVVMGCIATGVPHPVINWSFEGKDMQLLSNRATLSFQVTDKKMAGEYQCIANNGVGEPATTSILLKITYPPEVSTNKLWVHTSPGLRAELSCFVNSNPDAKVEWLKDGKIIDSVPRIVPSRTGDKHVLIIRNVRASDLGYYTCKAANGIGHGQQVIQLSGVANMATFKRNIKQSSGHNNYTLVWEVDSYSAIIEYSLLFRQHYPHSQPVEWSKLVIPADPYGLGPLHTQFYTLTGLKSATSYEASVLSRNRFGWSRPSDAFIFSTSKRDINISDDEDLDDLDEEKPGDGNILMPEELDKNIIETVISADSDASYNPESMISRSSCLDVRYTIPVISSVALVLSMQ